MWSIKYVAFLPHVKWNRTNNYVHKYSIIQRMPGFHREVGLPQAQDEEKELYQLRLLLLNMLQHDILRESSNNKCVQIKSAHVSTST